MKLRLVFLGLVTALALRAAGEVPVFNATLSMGKEHRFVLVDAAGVASGFLKLGETYAGWRLRAYDAAASALDLERDGRVERVKLVADATVKDSGPAKATVADAEAVLKQMHFEKMMERMLAQQTKAMGTMVDRMAAQMGAQGVDREELKAFQKKMMGEMMGSLSAPELSGDMAKIYSEVFTKGELDGLGAFYQSPLGEALSAKTPEVSERLNAVITPRIMAAMPKIQRMAQEFAMEQKAKRAAPPAAAAPVVAPAAPGKP